jgi:hypothetical protein
MPERWENIVLFIGVAPLLICGWLGVVMLGIAVYKYMVN